MKTYVYVLLILVVIMPSPLAYGEMAVSMGVRYDTFSDDQSPEGKGTELTLPVGVLYKQERWLLRLEAAYSQARVDLDENTDADIRSFTDTLLAGSYMFLDLPVGIVVGLDVNVPSGKERLRQTEQAAEAGERHDLFEVDNFGEGLNVGLNLGLVKELGPLNLEVSGAYIFKQQYDPTREISGDDLDPGDQMLVFMMLHWKAASWFRVETMTVYSHCLPEQIDGRNSFQEGEKLLLGGTLRLRRHPLEFALGVQNMVQKKGKELVEGTLKTEPENSSNPELFGWFDVTYRVSAKLDLQVRGDIRHYGESDRKMELNGLPFEGERLRYAIGPGTMYLLSDHISCNVLAKFFLMEQKQDILLEQDVTFRGVNVSVGATYTF